MKIIRWLNSLFFATSDQRRLQANCLDGIRGLAVIFVLFSHTSNHNLLLIPDLRFAGQGSGQLGVYLFFVLSAFLLTRALLILDSTQLTDFYIWGNYFLRRVLRIIPLYTVVLMTVMIGSYFNLPYFFQNFSPRLLIAHLVMLAGVDHFWSIPAEVRYYCILPVFVIVFVFLLKRRLKPAIILVLTISIIISAYCHYHTTDVPFAITRLLPLFLSGSLFAALHEAFHSKIGPDNNRTMIIISVACLISSIILMPNLFKLLFGISFPVRDPLMFNIIALLFGLLIFSVLNQNSYIRRFFESKIIRLIGIISFSIYLWHWFILEWIVRLEGLAVWRSLLLFFSLTFMLSIISFLLFERPFAKLRLIHILALFRAHWRVESGARPARL